METLPTEILEVIFMELSTSSLIDIVNCSRTCMRWKNIIEKMFKKDGKYTSRIEIAYTIPPSYPNLLNISRITFFYMDVETEKSLEKKYFLFLETTLGKYVKSR